MPEEWDTEEQDGEEQPAEGEGGESELELDEETAALFERRLAAEREKWQAEQKPVDVDAAVERALAKHLAGMRQQPAAPAAPPAAAEDPEPEYDAYDPKSVQAWTAWSVRQQTKTLAEENRTLRQMQAEDRIDRAMDRAEGLIGQYAPHLAPFLQHPDFRETYRQMLATQDPRSLSDRQSLVAMAAMVTTALDPEGLPKRAPAARPRDEQGRFEADAHRQALAQNTPSRGGGVPGGGREIDPEERRVAEIAGMSVEEFRAYGAGTTYEDHVRFQEAQRRKGRR